MPICRSKSKLIPWFSTGPRFSCLHRHRRRTRRRSCQMSKTKARTVTKITLTQFCHRVSILRMVSSGCVTFCQPPPRNLRSCTCKTNLRIAFKRDKLVRLVSAQSEKSSLLSASMSLSVRLRFRAQSVASFSCVSVTRSRWQFKLTKLCMKALSHTVCAKLSWPSKARTKWIAQSSSSKTPAMSFKPKSSKLSRRSKTQSAKPKKSNSAYRRLTTIKWNTSKISTTTTSKNWRLCFPLLPSESPALLSQRSLLNAYLTFVPMTLLLLRTS